MEQNKRERESAIDLIKTIAIVFVISFHLFSDAGYYRTMLKG